VADDLTNFGGGAAPKESQPIPISDISFLHITEATQLQFTQPYTENSISLGSVMQEVTMLSESAVIGQLPPLPPITTVIRDSLIQTIRTGVNDVSASLVYKHAGT
jgi:hypothetical protein